MDNLYLDFVEKEYRLYCDVSKSENIDPMEYDDFVYGSDYLLPLFLRTIENEQV